MTREEIEEVMGASKPIHASFEAIGDDGKFIKLIVNGKENIVSVEELENTLSEPCDCISREEVCDYIAEFVNHEYATDREREMVKNIIGGIQHLPSIQPTTKENLVVGDCMKREFIEIVVNYPPADLCTYPEYRGKPYFSIKYRENGNRYVGFGTYKIEMLSQWIKEYFMPSIQPKTDVLDKIRAEIEQMNNIDYVKPVTVDEVLQIIDKYKAEKE